MVIRLAIMIAISVVAMTPCFSKPLDFGRQLVGVEQKAAMEDQDINEVSDLFYGVQPEHFLARLKELEVNLITVPISRAGQAPTVAFLKGLKEVKGDQILSIVISHRKWSLDRARQREDWAVAIAKTFNAINDAGLSEMVAGCRFDENDPLKGAASTSAQWRERFENILDALDRLNQKTHDAFKKRSVLIHGEGYGSNFKGIYEAYLKSDFESKMRERCENYGFTFKLFDYGLPASGKNSSEREWEQHFRVHCGLDELEKLKNPVLFVGNAGDGLFPRSLDPAFEPKGTDQWYLAPRALLKIFKDKHWQHFAFGPFLIRSEKVGRTYLHSVQNTAIVAQPAQIKDWEFWRDSVALLPHEFRVFTKNEAGEKIEASIIDASSRGIVTLVRSDGVTFKDIPISLFSQVDQVFIREWRESHSH